LQPKEDTVGVSAGRTGFMVGSRSEQGGIIKDGAKNG